LLPASASLQAAAAAAGGRGRPGGNDAAARVAGAAVAPQDGACCQRPCLREQQQLQQAAVAAPAATTRQHVLPGRQLHHKTVSAANVRLPARSSSCSRRPWPLRRRRCSSTSPGRQLHHQTAVPASVRLSETSSSCSRRPWPPRRRRRGSTCRRGGRRTTRRWLLPASASPQAAESAAGANRSRQSAAPAMAWGRPPRSSPHRWSRWPMEPPRRGTSCLRRVLRSMRDRGVCRLLCRCVQRRRRWGAPKQSARSPNRSSARAAADVTLGSADAAVSAGCAGGCGGGAGGLRPASQTARPSCVVEVAVQKTRGKSHKWSRSHTPSPTGHHHKTGGSTRSYRRQAQLACAACKWSTSSSRFEGPSVTKNSRQLRPASAQTRSWRRMTRVARWARETQT